MVALLEAPASGPVTDGLRIDQLRLDSEYKLRDELCPDIVSEYAELLDSSPRLLPDIVVYKDSLGNQWVADGRYRVAAYRQKGLTRIACVIHEGSERDAFLYGLRANNRHGVRLSLREARRAVMILLRDEEWQKWNDAELARLAHVAPQTVTRYRRQLDGPPDAQTTRLRRDRYGNISSRPALHPHCRNHKPAAKAAATTHGHLNQPGQVVCPECGFLFTIAEK